MNWQSAKAIQLFGISNAVMLGHYATRWYYSGLYWPEFIFAALMAVSVAFTVLEIVDPLPDEPPA